jgi:hypothetical protein
MKSKKLMRILGTSWEALFHELITQTWEKGQVIDTIVLSEKASFPVFSGDVKNNKRQIAVYCSDFGRHRVKVDKRYKGDKILLYGRQT